jgi:hypothetical protein
MGTRNFLIVLLMIGVAMPASLMAQSESAPEPVIRAPRENFAAALLKDQTHLLSSPFHIRRGDVKWLLPLSAGAAALLATDHKVSAAVKDAEDIRPASRFLSRLGGGAPTMIASGSLYGIGKLTHNDKAADTGLLATEAILHSQLVVQGLKMMFNRERPEKINGNGGFWDGGRSFPSGHAATSFAFATVAAGKYKDKKLVVFGAYGLATAISMSRIGGMNHHPSDVLIGATIGHLIGRYILHRHTSDN